MVRVTAIKAGDALALEPYQWLTASNYFHNSRNEMKKKSQQNSKASTHIRYEILFNCLSGTTFLTCLSL